LKEYRFQLITSNKLPISFELEFMSHSKYYIYTVEISEKIVERLWLSGLGEIDNTLIFERNDSDIKSSYLQNESSSKQLLQLNKESSLFPLNAKFPVLQSIDVKNTFEWFSNKLDIVTIHSTIPMLIELMSNDRQLLQFTNSIFARIDVGINTINISVTPLEQWISKKKNYNQLQHVINKTDLTQSSSIAQLENNRNTFNISLKKGEKVVKEFLFKQFGLLGCEKQMNISAQSDGTVRLLTLIPAIYDAMKRGKVVFIDEIDNSIHPNLIFALIKYYADNESNGQLIFTTHTTKLLDQQNLFRLDELWITEKIDGNTTMRSFNDFKIHNTINIENGYLDGRYGGVPSINHIDNE
jgi:Predicted ATPase